MLFLLCCTVWIQNPLSDCWSALDAARFELKPLDGITSPSCIRCNDGRQWLCADLLESKPGVFHIASRESSSIQTQRSLTLPELDLTGMSRRADGRFFVIAANHFSNNPTDWRSLMIAVDLSRGQLGESRPFQVSNRCFDDRPACGIAGIVFLAGDRILALRSKDHPSLLLMEFIDPNWVVINKRVLFINRRMGYPVDLRIVGETLVILFRDRWLLAEVPLQEAGRNVNRSLHVQSAFDFSTLKRQISTNSSRLATDGLAEGFDFDDNGDLLIILNNRGYAFTKSPDGNRDRRPKLLRFLAAKKPDSESGDQHPSAKPAGKRSLGN